MLDDFLDFFDDEDKPLSRSRVTGKLHKFVVEKPFCCPASDIIVAALHPVGIPIYEMEDWVEQESLGNFAKRMKIELQTFENLRYGVLAPGFLPMACRASFSVPEQRANQAEYWLWRTARLVVIDGVVNPRNEISAAKHNGVMPRASDPRRGSAYAQSKEGNRRTVSAPKLESSCKQAQALWDQVLKLASKPPPPKPKRTKPAQARARPIQKRKKQKSWWDW